MPDENTYCMALFELVVPKMGESIMEATILSWSKNIGDKVEADETVLEIATDKVDSEVPSPVSGVIHQILHQVNDVVPVGTTIAIIDTGGDGEVPNSDLVIQTASNVSEPSESKTLDKDPLGSEGAQQTPVDGEKDLFLSPLVRNIAKAENLSKAELSQIQGSGLQGRITKKDIISYIAQGKSNPIAAGKPSAEVAAISEKSSSRETAAPSMSSSIQGDVEIIEMDRMRKLISDHMVMSKHTSPHVTSFVEVDVTNIVKWREGIKNQFKTRYGQNITFTPLFIEAIVKAIKDFPMINVSVDGSKIIKKNNINVGMAAALPSGNLIVPVIKDADRLNLLGLTTTVNDLSNRARNNQLKPEEIQGGTFTMTNVGTFGNVMGTPIINQPQVAIMAVGAIRKKPAVLETEFGDVIAIRQMMFLSLSYDHRVVDGMLGGSFLRKVADYLEDFDLNTTI